MRKYLLLVAASILFVFVATSQTKKYRLVGDQWIEVAAGEPAISEETVALEADTLLDVSGRVFTPFEYRPMIFDTYDLLLAPDSISNTVAAEDDDNPLRWVNDRVARDRRFQRFRQRYVMGNPQLVRYNVATLPEAPKHYQVFVDPATAQITVQEIVINPDEVVSDVKDYDFKRINWLQEFDGLVQFSQAFVSPNWYQGGNNNLNLIVNGVYSIKLNQAFHPNLMFENVLSYKLGINSAPDDSLRNYSISEDILQLNSKFGVRAATHWFYSLTLQFKTQVLNNYYKNTKDIAATFLAPGELNLGLGMTYEYTSKRLNINASVAPISYNLKICADSRVEETQFGIDQGKKTASQYGSNVDCTLKWAIAYNINYTTHLTAFTDYDYLQADWEHTLSFSINRFLSTQIYAHLRYDTTGARFPGSRWHKLQLKEILSFGFAYKFATV